MKQETLNAIRNDLNKEKKKMESRPTNFIYEIEYIPVLTERDSKGKLQQITNCNTRLIFENEN